MKRVLVPLLLLLALPLHGTTGAAPAVPRATCSYPILALGEIAQRARIVVLGDVIRERQDDSGAYSSSVRVLSELKGRLPAPIVTIGDLGHLADDCTGGPRLPRGGRYVLFLAQTGNGSNAVFSLVDNEGGVYQLGAGGVRFPPARALGDPQVLPVASAEFIRDVAISLLGDDPARIEELIAQRALPETVDAPAATEKARPFYERLPKRELSLAVAGGAVLLASLTFLLWRPRGPDAYPRR